MNAVITSLIGGTLGIALGVAFAALAIAALALTPGAQPSAAHVDGLGLDHLLGRERHSLAHVHRCGLVINAKRDESHAGSLIRKRSARFSYFACLRTTIARHCL